MKRKSTETNKAGTGKTYHEIIRIDGHKTPQDLFRPDPISLGGCHKGGVHVYKVLVPLGDIYPASPRRLALISAHYRHLRSDPTWVRRVVWRREC